MLDNLLRQQVVELQCHLLRLKMACRLVDISSVKTGEPQHDRLDRNPATSLVATRVTVPGERAPSIVGCRFRL